MKIGSIHDIYEDWILDEQIVFLTRLESLVDRMIFENVHELMKRISPCHARQLLCRTGVTVTLDWLTSYRQVESGALIHRVDSD